MVDVGMDKSRAMVMYACKPYIFIIQIILHTCYPIFDKDYRYNENWYTYCWSVIYVICGGLYCSPLLCLLITQQQLDQMARTKQTRRKRVSAVPGLPAEIVVAIAEVVATHRLDLQLLLSGYCIIMTLLANGN